MATLETQTVSVAIDRPFEVVMDELSRPERFPVWATEFYAGPTRPSDTAGEVLVDVPMMGGETRFRVDVSSREHGVIALLLAPTGGPFGPPLPVRVLHNADGVDVQFTLARFPDMPQPAWEGGLVSMRKELGQLKVLLEGQVPR